jgi:hypothetical protein
MTIKISDLSVGDWVEYEGLHYPITFVGYGEGGDGSLVNLIRPDLSCFTCKISDIHPIPITAEILGKNGFTRRSSEFPIYEHTTLLGKMLRTIVVSLLNPYDYIFCRIEDISKELHEDGRCLVSSNVSRHPIFVHDLQHALRLAGVDKEINL